MIKVKTAALSSYIGKRLRKMKALKRPQWTKDDVRTAICHNEFVPFFQPKIDLATGVASCVEVLARWDHPDFGVLPPSQFIKLMEGTGLIDQFTYNLLRQSLVSAVDNAGTGKEIGMAINFSTLTLQDQQTTRRICSMVKEYGVSFEQITIEVTESAIPDNFSSMIKTLSFLRSQGFKISIDDFGTGYSSLKQLSKIPFTELKIDKMFVVGISKDRKLTGILESIVHLAKKLALCIVAEGIETKTQFEFIRTLGCNTGQGFYLGAPMRSLKALNTAEDVRLAMA
jgi:EAL domain-containing protein (putative c-di-GMP-specific phosphodiesterase class I)